MKRRIAIIGAGSIVFCKTLIQDVLATPGMEGTEFALMDPNLERAKEVERFVNDVIKHNGLDASVFVTDDRVAAVTDAKFIITTFQIGGVAAFEMDYKIPLKYGVDQCIGDSMNPGGLFRALRTIPVIVDVAEDVKKYAHPDAIILNYVNPMAMVCWALGTTGVKHVGLCHGVQTTLDLIAGYVDVPKEEIDFLCAGINHMGWFLDIKHNGKDMYPLLKERFEKPEYYVNEKVRGEVFRHYGYFMTESTGHLSEYLPWFRSSQRASRASAAPAVRTTNGAPTPKSSMRRTSRWLMNRAICRKEASNMAAISSKRWRRARRSSSTATRKTKA